MAAGVHHPRCFLAFAIVCGILFILSLVVAFVILPNYIDSEIAKAMRLDDFTNQWDRFMTLPFPVLLKVYIFEITNPDQVRDGTQLPKLKETGPFVYHEHRTKTIEELNENDTATYRQHHMYHFSSELSGDLSDEQEVTVLNPSMMTIIHLASDLEKYILSTTDCIRKVFQPPYNDLFIKIKVKDLLFNGYKFSDNNPFDGCFLEKVIIKLKSQKVRNAKFVYDDKGTFQHLQFSYFNFKNNSDDGAYTVNRGRDSISDLGSISLWNYENEVKNWGTPQSTNNETCNKVRGTDSTLYPAHIEKDSKFEIFSTDICRTVQIKFKEEEVYSDISGYRFETDETTLRSSLDDKKQDCFCTYNTPDQNNKENCYLDGVIDMQPCFGAQVLFSMPHFLWADEKYLNGVQGLSPDEEKHKIFLLVEPNTGTPLKGAKRIQLNMVLRPEKLMTIASKLPKTIVPLLWVEEGISLGHAYIDELNSRYFSRLHLATAAKWSFFSVTLTLTLFFIAMFVWRNWFVPVSGRPDVIPRKSTVSES